MPVRDRFKNNTHVYSEHPTLPTLQRLAFVFIGEGRKYRSSLGHMTWVLVAKQPGKLLLIKKDQVASFSKT